jgi:hypothetical protein
MVLLKLAASSVFVLRLIAGEECAINTKITRSSPTVFDLAGLGGITFVGIKPRITRMPAKDPSLKILGYSTEIEPTLEVVDGRLVVSHSACSASSSPAAIEDAAVEVADIAPSGASGRRDWHPLAALASVAAAALSGGAAIDLVRLSAWGILSAGLLAEARSLTCEDVVEVEIHGPAIQLPSLVQAKSSGARYMESDIKWPLYDGSEDSQHFTAEPTWSSDIEAIRAFRETESGGVYNYRRGRFLHLDCIVRLVFVDDPRLS